MPIWHFKAFHSSLVNWNIKSSGDLYKDNGYPRILLPRVSHFVTPHSMLFDPFAGMDATEEAARRAKLAWAIPSRDGTRA